MPPKKKTCGKRCPAGTRCDTSRGRCVPTHSSNNNRFSSTAVTQHAAPDGYYPYTLGQMAVQGVPGLTAEQARYLHAVVAPKLDHLYAGTPRQRFSAVRFFQAAQSVFVGAAMTGFLALVGLRVFRPDLFDKLLGWAGRKVVKGGIGVAKEWAAQAVDVGRRYTGWNWTTDRMANSVHWAYGLRYLMFDNNVSPKFKAVMIKIKRGVFTDDLLLHLATLMMDGRCNPERRQEATIVLNAWIVRTQATIAALEKGAQTPGVKRWLEGLNMFLPKLVKVRDDFIENPFYGITASCRS